MTDWLSDIVAAAVSSEVRYAAPIGVLGLTIGGRHFAVSFNPGRVEALSKPPVSPAGSISLSEADAQKIASGSETAQRLFLEKRMEMRGNTELLLYFTVLVDARAHRLNV